MYKDFYSTIKKMEKKKIILNFMILNLELDDGVLHNI